MLQASVSSAQYHDFGSWLGGTINKEIVDDLNMSTAIQMRLQDNFTTVGSGLVDVRLGYKISKHWSLGVAYRFTQKNDFRAGWQSRHRLQFRILAKKKRNKLRFQYRSIVQLGLKELYRRENIYDPKIYWRNRLRVKLDLDKKYEPYAGLELFYAVNRFSGFDAVRLLGGLNWDLPKKMELKTGYIFQTDITKTNSPREHVLIVGYSKSF